MSPNKCLVIGDINIDFDLHARHYPSEGGEAQAEQADFRLGGSGCLTALYLQLLGLPTALAAAMGTDVFSQFAAEYLSVSGIDESFIRKLPDEQTGFFMILVTPGGQRTMFGSRGANTAAFDADALIARLGEFGHLHISGYFLLEDEQYGSVRRVMTSAKARGITISLDPGLCPSEQASDRILGLLKEVDYFLPSREELGLLADDLEPEESITMLLELGCGAVVLKMGSEGAKYYKNGFSVSVPPEIEAGKVILDTTGAGDCFNAGFIHGMLNGYTPENALKQANTAAYKLITSEHGIMDLIKKSGLPVRSFPIM